MDSCRWRKRDNNNSIKGLREKKKKSIGLLYISCVFN